MTISFLSVLVGAAQMLLRLIIFDAHRGGHDVHDCWVMVVSFLLEEGAMVTEGPREVVVVVGGTYTLGVIVPSIRWCGW